MYEKQIYFIFQEQLLTFNTPIILVPVNGCKVKGFIKSISDEDIVVTAYPIQNIVRYNWLNVHSIIKWEV
jgi:hypothetical protein